MSIVGKAVRKPLLSILYTMIPLPYRLFDIRALGCRLLRFFRLLAYRLFVFPIR